MSDIVVKPLAPSLHDEVLRFFDFSAYADNPHWASCYDCFWFHKGGSEWNARTKEENRAERSAIVRSGTGNGLVAYRLGRVVGWCQAAPRSELPLLAIGDPSAATDATTGAVVCFVVAPDARRQGVATTLLAAAVDHLRERSMSAIEAYPLADSPDDPTVWPRRNYHGPLSMFLRAGFHETKRDKNVVTVRMEL